MTSTPYASAIAQHPLPFELWPMQQDCVNQLAPLQRSAYYAEVGTGKTAMSTAAANYQRITGMADAHLIVVPPVLITQWMRWLERVPGVKALAYRGTPKQRNQLEFYGYDFIVMSMQIFKQDYVRIAGMCKDAAVGLIVDEATSIKNSGSHNHKYVRDFCTGRPLILLTGTPLASPADGYAYVKLLAPEIYRNQRVFESVHVESVDIFGNVTKWHNLDLLKKNMAVNSIRLLKPEVLPNLPQPIYMPMPYELAPEHLALYKRLAEEQIIELESGGKIDATTVSRLYNCLQQVILNWGHFSENEKNVPAGFDLCDQVLAEIGAGQPDGRKLVIFANYRMTMASLLSRYGRFNIQIINGDVTGSARERAIARFMGDPSCSVIAIQPKSGSYGVDGLQNASSDVLFCESPTSPIEFEQSVGRVYRSGQRNPPLIRIAVAENTLQVKLHKSLLNKDELANFVQGGWKSLREALYGG